MSIQAVITGDLVDSSQLTNEEMNLAITTLKEKFEGLEAEGNKFSLFRGDSFQGLVKDAKDALKIALKIKTSLNQLMHHRPEKTKDFNPGIDARIAIGLGATNTIRSKIEESDGEAFQNSGRSLDKMKEKSQSLIIKTPWVQINRELETSCKLFDALTDRWSTASAEVLYYLLDGKKEHEIAAILKISQPAVNFRKKALHWDAIEQFLVRYEEIVHQKLEENA